tara:strand:- start:891 stop:1142 length:252 start_codon:yes stop_codon:yes gene_type:complete
MSISRAQTPRQLTGGTSNKKGVDTMAMKKKGGTRKMMGGGAAMKKKGGTRMMAGGGSAMKNKKGFAKGGMKKKGFAKGGVRHF